MIHKDDTLAGREVTNIICREVEVSAQLQSTLVLRILD